MAAAMQRGYELVLRLERNGIEPWMNAMQLGIEQSAFTRRDNERRFGGIALHFRRTIVLVDSRIIAEQPGLQTLRKRDAGRSGDDLIANATSKLRAKHLDLIVANDVGAPQVGFAHDTNAVTLLRPDAEPVEIDLASKRDVARAVIDTIVSIRSPHRQDFA